jgi:hypothetical protein
VRLSVLAVFLLLTTPAFAVELFRYRGAARDGGTLEYVFETDEEHLPQTVAKEKVAEIAADFMTVFYHIQIGSLETQEFRQPRFHSGSYHFRRRPKGQRSKCTLLSCCLMGRSLNPAFPKRM